MFGLFKKKEKKHVLGAVAKGKAVPLSAVNDPTFSQAILGEGAAVIPAEGKVYAPVDGKVEMVFETLHALSITADFGAEVLVHVGLDTVQMKGDGFEAHVAAGDQVKKGEPLIRFDAAFMEKKGIDMTTMLILLNPGQYQFKTLAGGQQVKKNVDTVIECSR